MIKVASTEVLSENTPIDGIVASSVADSTSGFLIPHPISAGIKADAIIVVTVFLVLIYFPPISLFLGL